MGLATRWAMPHPGAIGSLACWENSRRGCSPTGTIDVEYQRASNANSYNGQSNRSKNEYWNRPGTDNHLDINARLWIFFSYLVSNLGAVQASGLRPNGQAMFR
jgi:hypothetical protein